MLNPKKENLAYGFLKPEYPFKDMSIVKGKVVGKFQNTFMELLLKIVIKTNVTKKLIEFIFLAICTTTKPDFNIVHKIRQ
mgnify:CR=1 FL=1